MSEDDASNRKIIKVIKKIGNTSDNQELWKLLKYVRNILELNNQLPVFIANDGIGVLLRILSRPNEHAVTYRVVSVLEYCTTSREGRDEVIKGNGVKHVSLLLQIDNDNVVERTCKCIANLARDSYACVELHKRKVLDVIVTLLKTKEKTTTQMICISALRALGDSRVHVRRIVDRGGVALIARHLASENNQLVIKAAKTLQQFTSYKGEEQITKQIEENSDGWNALMTLCSQENAAIRQSCLHILINVSGSIKLLVPVAKAGAVDILVKQIKQPSVRFPSEHMFYESLCNFCKNVHTRMSVCTKEGLLLLVDVLKQESKKRTHQVILRTLPCFTDTLTLKYLISLGIIDILTTKLEYYTEQIAGDHVPTVSEDESPERNKESGMDELLCFLLPDYSSSPERCSSMSPERDPTSPSSSPPRKKRRPQTSEETDTCGAIVSTLHSLYRLSQESEKKIGKKEVVLALVNNLSKARTPSLEAATLLRRICGNTLCLKTLIDMEIGLLLQRKIMESDLQKEHMENLCTTCNVLHLEGTKILDALSVTLRSGYGEAILAERTTSSETKIIRKCAVAHLLKWSVKGSLQKRNMQETLDFLISTLLEKPNTPFLLHILLGLSSQAKVSGVALADLPGSYLSSRPSGSQCKREELECDVTLSLSNGKVKMNKESLAEISPVLSAMFFGAFKEATEAEVDMSDASVEAVEYLYHWSAGCDCEAVWIKDVVVVVELMNLCDKYLIPELYEKMYEELRQRFLYHENIVAILKNVDVHLAVGRDPCIVELMIKYFLTGDMSTDDRGSVFEGIVREGMMQDFLENVKSIIFSNMNNCKYRPLEIYRSKTANYLMDNFI